MTNILFRIIRSFQERRRIGPYQLTQHAEDRMCERHFSPQDILHAINHGKKIKDKQRPDKIMHVYEDVAVVLDHGNNQIITIKPWSKKASLLFDIVEGLEKLAKKVLLQPLQSIPPYKGDQLEYNQKKQRGENTSPKDSDALNIMNTEINRLNQP